MIHHDAHLGYGLKPSKLFPTTSVYHITVRATKLRLFRLAFRATFSTFRHRSEAFLFNCRLSCLCPNVWINKYRLKFFTLVKVQINIAKTYIVKLGKLSNSGIYTECFVRFADRRIIHLQSLCRPPTVFWLVVTVVVYAIKSEFATGLFPHIFKKVNKAFGFLAPTITNRYAPTTIPIISSIFRIIAPCNHSSPAIVLKFVNGPPTMSVIEVELTTSAFHTIHYNTKCNNVTGVIYV